MKKYVIMIFFAAAIALLANGCQNENAEKATPTTQQTATETPNNEEALALLTQNCYACHDPKAAEGNRLAPPMRAVKEHYLADSPSKEEFTAAMVKFMKAPSSENSKMPKAIERFGVMPNLSLPTEQLELIANYVYDNDIETPDWFDAHFQKEQQANNNELPFKKGDYLAQGRHYAMTTKTTLGKNLMGAIKKKGTEGAVTFCNTKAYPLTDSMATQHNARIKRVSDKPRNPENQANATELKHIATFKAALAAGKEPKPVVEELGKSIRFYAPITTNEMCLQCHGKPENIAANVQTKVKKLYPNDKAIGYGDNEVRGIWSIEFER